MNLKTMGLPPLGWQWVRKGVQLAAIFLLFALPLLARYHNYVASHKTDEFIEKWDGRPQGEALAATDWLFRATGSEEEVWDGTPRRNRKEIMERVERYRGSVWSMELAGISMTDPLAGAESVVASKNVPWVLLVGLAIPVIATLLLGRIFCSWVCPMNTLLEATDKVRGLLRFLELPPKDVRFWRGNKYILLGLGLVAALLYSIPLLGYFYPPAVMGREAHSWVNTFMDQAEHRRSGFTWLSGLSMASGFILLIVLVEVFVSRRMWCRYLCPGGGLYSLLGKFRPVRVRRNVKVCTDCADCTKVCGMALSPMRDVTGIECDNCALCISNCEPRALSFTFHFVDPKPAGPGQKGPSYTERASLVESDRNSVDLPNTKPLVGSTNVNDQGGGSA